MNIHLKRFFSIAVSLCLLAVVFTLHASAVTQTTKDAARRNFGLSDSDKVNYHYINNKDTGAYKKTIANPYPHFISTGSGNHHIHGQLIMDKDINPNETGERPNNIEITSGGNVKLYFDGTLDEGGLIYDYSRVGKDTNGISNQYGMVKIKNGKSSDKKTNVEIHFAGECKIAAPAFSSAINAYGENCDVKIVLHDDCKVTLIGGHQAAAIGGGYTQDGRNITITTDGTIKKTNNGEVYSHLGNGTLICTGGTYGAGIGSGALADADNIKIERGNIITSGGESGAGIGTGVSLLKSGDKKSHNASNISITGGTVTANGFQAAAIGGGSSGSAENITISGGHIIAKSKNIGYGMCIGYGKNKNTDSEVKYGNIKLNVPNNTKAVFSFGKPSGTVLEEKYFFSMDKFDIGNYFTAFSEKYSISARSVEIEFNRCNDHKLTWNTNGHYQYCANCQTVTMYDDSNPEMSGLTDTVYKGSSVDFTAKEYQSTDENYLNEKRTVTHKYTVNKEERSVDFKVTRKSSYGSTSSGLKYVKVFTLGYNSDDNSYSKILNTETLSGKDGKYSFKGANGYNEYKLYSSEKSKDEKYAALKMQRIYVIDNAGNQTTYDLIAFLSHKVTCTLEGEIQPIGENGETYLNVLDGGGFKLTYLKDKAHKLDYQWFYEISVNGKTIPTTEDNVYKFDDVHEDKDIEINVRLDKTSPLLKININGKDYDSTQSENDQKPCNNVNTAANVTLEANDPQTVEGDPVSGIRTSTLEYLISEKPMSQDELKNADNWNLYNGTFTLPDSKAFIVYARVDDIAGNSAFAVSEPYMSDVVAPEISGISGNPEKWVGTDQKISFSVYDANLKDVEVTLENEKIDVNFDAESNKYSFIADGNGEYVITAVDTLENQTTETVNVTKIDKAVPSITVDADSDTIRNKAQARISASSVPSGVTVYVSKNGGERVKMNSDIFTTDENGDYTFYAVSGAGLESSATVSYSNIDTLTPKIAADTHSYTVGSWTNKSITVSPKNTAGNLGTTEFRYKLNGGEWSDWTTDDIIIDNEGTTVCSIIAKSQSGIETSVENPFEIECKIDKTIPDCEIAFNGNSVKQFFNKITFGLLYNQNINVSITANDIHSGVKSIEYYKSDEILTEQEAASLSDNVWEKGDSFTITAADRDKLIIYARVTDNAGNQAIFASNGAVFDLSSPTISGIEDKMTYCEPQTVTVTDDNLDKIMIDGTEITLDENNQFVISPKADEQTITAVDKIGNKTVVTVKVNSTHSFGEWSSNGNGTHSRICSVDASHTETEKCSGGTATCKDKAKCEICNDSYGELDAQNHSSLKHFDANDSTETAEGNIEYWFCEGCGKYFSDKDCKNEITKADIVIPIKEKSPQTGAEECIPLFVLLFVSCGTAICTANIGKKKKQSK